MDYTSILTLFGTLIAAYMSYRLGKLQLKQTTYDTDRIDKTTGETEFRKSLLELIDQQEDKMIRQDAKIEKLDRQIEQSKALTDDLKRANFNLTLDNHRLTRMTEMLESELQVLRDEIRLLKEKQDASK